MSSDAKSILGTTSPQGTEPFYTPHTSQVSVSLKRNIFWQFYTSSWSTQSTLNCLYSLAHCVQDVIYWREVTTKCLSLCTPSAFTSQWFYVNVRRQRARERWRGGGGKQDLGCSKRMFGVRLFALSGYSVFLDPLFRTHAILQGWKKTGRNR